MVSKMRAFNEDTRERNGTMFNRDDCGVVLGRCGRHKCVHFTCPTCDAKHDRGWVGYTPGTFRCLHCGYSGHGIHPDADIDRAEYAHHVASGLPMTWPDPLNGPG